MKKIGTGLFLSVMLVFILLFGTGWVTRVNNWRIENSELVSPTISGTVTLEADLDVGDYNITNVGSIALDSVIADGSAIAIGAGTETVAIDSSDWDIGTDGAITGVSFDANGTGNSISNVDLTADITGTLPVENGGTEATTLTDGGILLGSGTGAITPMAVLADGSIIVGDGATDPVALAAFSSSTGDLLVTAGGTGVSALTDHCVFVGSGTDAVTILTVGGANEVLCGAAGADPSFRALTDADIPNAITLASITTGAFGSWGYTGEHVALTATSDNTNAGLGEYFEIASEIAAGKVMAGEYSRLLCSVAQPNQVTMVGTESQFRLRNVSIGNGVHAGLWAYAEQSGTSVLSGNGTFDAISATVESEVGFTVGATEQVTGITVDSSINSGASIDGSANFSGIYIKSN